jgi:hypothetical protein
MAQGISLIRLKKNENGEIIYGMAINTLYYFVPDSAIYLSVNQYNYWVNLNVDMTLIGGGD